MPRHPESAPGYIVPVRSVTGPQDIAYAWMVPRRGLNGLRHLLPDMKRGPDCGRSLRKKTVASQMGRFG